MKAQICLRLCAGWSGPALSANYIKALFVRCASIIAWHGQTPKSKPRCEKMDHWGQHRTASVLIDRFVFTANIQNNCILQNIPTNSKHPNDSVNVQAGQDLYGDEDPVAQRVINIYRIVINKVHRDTSSIPTRTKIPVLSSWPRQQQKTTEI